MTEDHFTLPDPALGNVWQYVEISVLIANGEDVLWHLVGRGQGYSQSPYSAQDTPHEWGYPAPNLNSAEAEKASIRPAWKTLEVSNAKWYHTWEVSIIREFLLQISDPAPKPAILTHTMHEVTRKSEGPEAGRLPPFYPLLVS